MIDMTEEIELFDEDAHEFVEKKLNEMLED
jgi:hypothetical protein